MTNQGNEQDGWDVDRRSFMQSAAVPLGLSSVSESGFADDSRWGSSTFVVEQGGSTYELEAIRGDLPVEDFYGADGPGIRAARSADSGGTTYSTPDGESHLLIYDGPAGRSLVIAHDRRGNQSGGSATFSIYGLPDGSWRVRENDVTSDSGLSWTWDDRKGAGAVYRGDFHEEFALTLAPEFEHGIETWRAVGDQMAVSLALDEPIVVRSIGSGSPPSIPLATVSSPTSFILEQDGKQYQMNAMASGDPIEAFYDGGTGLDAPATSRLFFWDDPERESEVSAEHGHMPVDPGPGGGSGDDPCPGDGDDDNSDDDNGDDDNGSGGGGGGGGGGNQSLPTDTDEDADSSDSCPGDGNGSDPGDGDEDETILVDETSLGIVNGTMSGHPNVGMSYSGLPDDGDWVVQNSSSDTFKQTQTEWELSSSDPTGGAYRNVALQETELELTPTLTGAGTPPFDALEVISELGRSIPVSNEWQRTEYIGPDRWGDDQTVEGFEPPVYVLALTDDWEHVENMDAPEQLPVTYEFERIGNDRNIVPIDDGTKPNDIYLVLKPRPGEPAVLKLASTGDDVGRETDIHFEGVPVLPEVGTLPDDAQTALETYKQGVARFQALTGEPDNLFPYKLNTDEPITIQPGTLDAELPEDIEAKLDQVENLNDAIERETTEVLDDDLAEQTLNQEIESFIEYVEQKYELVRGYPSTQFDEALHRSIGVQNVTSAAVSAPQTPIRGIVETGVTAIGLVALDRLVAIVRSVSRGNSVSDATVESVKDMIGGASTVAKAVDDGIEEVQSQAERLRTKISPLDALHSTAYHQYRNLREEAIEDLGKAMAETDEAAREEVIDDLISDTPEKAYQTASQLGVLGPIEEIFEGVVDGLYELVYSSYVLGGPGSMASIVFDDPVADGITTASPTGGSPQGINPTAERSTRAIKRGFQQRNLSTDGRDSRDELSQDASSFIIDASIAADDTIEKFENIEDWLSDLELIFFGGAALSWVVTKASEISGISFLTRLLKGATKILLLISKALAFIILAILGSQVLLGGAFIGGLAQLHQDTCMLLATNVQ